MAKPVPSPTSKLRGLLRRDLEKLMTNTMLSMPNDTVYHRRTSDPVPDDEGNVIYDEDTYDIRGIITAFKPSENDILNTKITLGDKTFHYVISQEHTDPQIGLPFEPRVMDYIVFNGIKYEVMGYDITTDENEYKIHCQKVDID